MAQNNHVRGDVFYRFWSVRTQATLDLILFFVFSFPGIIALVWAGYYFAEMAWRFGERSMLTPSGPPLDHFKTVIPVAGFFTALQGVAEVMRAIIALRTGRWPARSVMLIVYAATAGVSVVKLYAGAFGGGAGSCGTSP